MTQAVALATRRDFMFGLIPAFDPAGSRNLIAWLLEEACEMTGVAIVLVGLARSFAASMTASRQQPITAVVTPAALTVRRKAHRLLRSV